MKLYFENKAFIPKYSLCFSDLDIGEKKGKENLHNTKRSEENIYFTSD